MKLNTNRGSGRTTRMLKKAIEEAKTGKLALIYTVTSGHADNIAQQLLYIIGHNHFRSKSPRRLILNSGGGFVLRILNDELCLVTGRVRGFSPECPVFVDHYVLEANYGFLLDQWIRWNLDKADDTAE